MNETMTENNADLQWQNEEYMRCLRLLMQYDYTRTAEIMNVEKQIYAALKQNPENVNGLIVLMQEQIMLGNHQRAKALAYKIWEIGGHLTVETENLYIQNLINIGLIEMAGVLLNPRFENMNENIFSFYPSMLKYAIASGDSFLIEKINLTNLSAPSRQMLVDFLNVNRQLNYTEHFSNLQKQLYAQNKEVMLSYDINLYNDRGFTDMEIVLYVSNDILDVNQHYEKMEMQVISYCAVKKIKRLNNLCFLIRPISAHPALLNRPA